VTEADVAKLRDLGERMEHTSDAVPALAVRRDVARARLQEAGYDLADLERATAPVDLSRLRLEGTALIRADTAIVPNVIGILPGADPKLRAEYVVVSAHFDHLGARAQAGKPDSIYNGVDDNASGTAAMLAIGQALSAGRTRPKRSIIFLGLSAEEKGILGSEYFVAHPPVPRGRLVADINLDGIGRAWQRDTVSAIGGKYSTLGASVARAATRTAAPPLTVVENQWPDRTFYESSDQIRFATAGIPSVYFYGAGPHPDYHQPSDDLRGLDAGYGARVAEVAGATALEVADAPARPEWTDQAPARFRNARLASQSSGRPRA
jgi:Zn-dependent M28 family amino/carboxypeptidase